MCCVVPSQLRPLPHGVLQRYDDQANKNLGNETRLIKLTSLIQLKNTSALFHRLVDISAGFVSNDATERY